MSNIRQCAGCRNNIIDENYYSFSINYERFDGDNAYVLNSFELLALCKECIQQFPFHYYFSFGADTFRTTASDNMEDRHDMD